MELGHVIAVVQAIHKVSVFQHCVSVKRRQSSCNGLIDCEGTPRRSKHFTDYLPFSPPPHSVQSIPTPPLIN